ncbi:MAG: TonB-dependent receptor, partial [Candidatus Aminicenantes bacterium]|nr:TonB-dependent receptor [Candidatus Aminicenantes bacterium]
MKKRFLCLTFIIWFLAAGTAFAQLTPEGKITGRVIDNQGIPLPGVNVEATSPRLVGKATSVTDGNGTFRLMALPSGTYEIVFSLPGFKTLIRKGIYLELSQTLTMNVTLEQAAVEERITVVGQAPLIDIKSTTKGQVMTKEIYMSLPRGRSFDSLISTIPGVQSEGIAGGISVDGASGAENIFFIDGADMTNFHLGIKGQNVVLELLDEVKVTASGYNAEYGGSMGGVVNVISRSGGNEF